MYNRGSPWSALIQGKAQYCKGNWAEQPAYKKKLPMMPSHALASRIPASSMVK